MNRWGLLVVAFACCWPTVITWLYFVVFAGHKAMGAVYAVGKLTQFSLPIVYWWWVRRRIDLRQLLLPRDLVPAIAFGGLVLVGMAVLYPWISSNEPLVARVRSEALPRLQGLGLASPYGFAVLAAFYSLIHSFLEEYYWRWFVYGELRGVLTRWPATIVSSIAFTAHHVIVVAVYFRDPAWTVFLSACVAVGGAVWCWMYERSRSLVGIWLSHLLVDAGIMAVGYAWLREALNA